MFSNNSIRLPQEDKGGTRQEDKRVKRREARASKPRRRGKQMMPSNDHAFSNSEKREKMKAERGSQDTSAFRGEKRKKRAEKEIEANEQCQATT